MSRTKVKNVSDLKPEPEGRQWAHHEPGLFLSLCCVKRLREPVRTCVCSDGEESQPACLCFSPELVCFGWEGGVLRWGHWEKNSLGSQSADCLDNIIQTVIVAVMTISSQQLWPPLQRSSCFLPTLLQMLRFLRRLSLKMFGCPINVYLPFPKSYWEYEARFKYKYMATNWSMPGPGSDQT